MKFFIVVFAILAVVNADWTAKTAAEIKDIRIECLKDHPLSQEQIDQMKQLNFPDEEAVRKYLECTAIKMDIFCTAEGYHADRIVKQFKWDLQEADALVVAENCIDKNEQGSPSDVWAFRGHKCLMASVIGDKLRAYLKKKQEEAKKNELPKVNP